MNNIMKALSFSKYGSTDFLKWIEKPIPKPKEGEVVIRVHAASLNQADLYTLKGFGRLSGMGMWNPEGAVLGADMAGEVTSIGDGVTEFKIGDRVFGDLYANGFGAFAEFVCVPTLHLVKVPDQVSLEDAAATPMAGVTAMNAIQMGSVWPGAKVMIYGASGGVGTFAVQLARHSQLEITAVCSLDKIEQCKALGAHRVMDYKKEEMSDFVDQFDLILAVNGYKSIRKYKRALNAGGRYLMIGGEPLQMIQALSMGKLISLMSSKTMGFVSSKPNKTHLSTLASLLESRVVIPVIDTVYPFSELMEAMRHLDAGHVRGKLVIQYPV